MNKKATSLQKPSDNFRKAVRQILAVPKAELERRERVYQATQNEKRKHSRRHR